MRSLLLVFSVACGPPPQGGAAEDSSALRDTAPLGTTPPTSTDCTTPPPSGVLGTGAAEYLPIDDGDPVTMVHGPQGGWHIDTGGVVAGTDGLVGIAPMVTRVDTQEVIALRQDAQFLALDNYDPEQCSGEFFAVRAFIDDFALGRGQERIDYICKLEGVTLDLNVEVEKLQTDEVVVLTKRVVAELDAYDVAICEKLGR